MPNTTSAKKALRQGARRRVQNIRKSRSLKIILKNFERALTSKNQEEAIKLLPQVQKALDKAAKTNLLKKNTVGRKKSRLVRRLKTLS